MKKRRNKTNRFKVMAEAFAFNKLKEMNLPTDHIDYEHVTKDQLKQMIKEEFGKVKDVKDLKPKLDTHFDDADLENEIEWLKALNIKESLGVE